MVVYGGNPSKLWQSYATDSETEEQEKKRFFEKVEQHGKPDYAALRFAKRAQYRA